jgi:hypothetical protein
MATLLDDIDCNILGELQKSARIPFAELGRRVRLSTPATIERVHRLERERRCPVWIFPVRKVPYIWKLREIQISEGL